MLNARPARWRCKTVSRLRQVWGPCGCRGFSRGDNARSRRHLGAALFFLVVLDALGATRAVDQIQLQVEQLAGPGWQGEALNMQITLDATSADDGPLSITLSTLELLGVRLRDVRLECSRGAVADTGIECRQAKLAFVGQPDARVTLPVDLYLGRERFHIQVYSPSMPGVELEARAEGEDGVWQAETSYQLVDHKAIGALLRGLLGTSAPDVEQGKAELELEMSKQGAETRGVAALRLRDLSLSDATGLNAGAELDAAFDISFEGRAPHWEFRASMVLQSGGLFVAPWFIAADPHPVSVDFGGSYHADDKTLMIRRVVLDHPGILQASGGMTLGLGQTGPQIDALALNIPRQPAGAVYDSYVAPWMSANAFGEFEIDGDIALELDWQRVGTSALALGFDALSAVEAEQQLGIYDLSGVLHWGRGRSVDMTRLRWGAVKLFSFELGHAELQGELLDNHFALSRPVRVSLLDGAIEVGGLDVEHLPSGQTTWRISGALTPVSMGEVSRTLGWPEFSGTVSGTIPDARYADGRLTLGGDVQMEAFDGTIVIRSLELEDPFGFVPKLRADVALNDISLGALTDTFSFGSIEGRLEGRIDELVLEDWQPRSFDAWFATPENDRSRHRISQRAVENLAEIGGTGEVFSSTILRLFDKFSYARLGLRCRLRNGVCEMGGVEPAPQGYYIVKGGGFIPRIDVIGFNERVDWNTLVDRLEGATSLPMPIVK